MSKLQDQLNNKKQQIKVAEMFLLQHEAKIPEGLGIFVFSDEYPIYFVYLDPVTQNERDRALIALGNIFGRSGWEAQLEYRGRHFDWSKTVDGIKLSISCAQPMGKPEKFPVDPKSFPLQLEEGTDTFSAFNHETVDIPF